MAVKERNGAAHRETASAAPASWFGDGVVKWLVSVSLWFGMVLGANVEGSDGTWRLPGGGDWDDPASWLPGVPNGVGDIATFGSLGPTADATIVPNNPITIGTLNVSIPHDLTIDGPNAITFDDTGSGGTATILVGGVNTTTRINADLLFVDDDLTARVNDGGSSLWLSGSFGAASSDLTVDGTGTVLLDADNGAWTGRIQVDAGTLVAAFKTALGSGGGTAADGTQVNAAGTLRISRSRHIAGELVRLNGGVLSGSGSGTARMSGPVEVLGDSRLTNATNSGSLRITGPITGSGDLRFDLGTLRLGGVNTFTGALRINGGRVEVEAAGSLSGQDLQINAGTAHVDFTDTTPIQLGLVTLRNNTTISATIDAPRIAADGLTLEGGTFSAGLTGATTLSKTTAGIAKLTGDNDFIGHTTIHDGTLLVSSPTALGFGGNTDADGTTVLSGGTLQIEGAFDIPGEKFILDSGRIRTSADDVTRLGGDVRLDGVGFFCIEVAALRLDGQISGAGTLHLESGELVLAGANAFTGATRVDDGGFLRLVDDGSLVQTGSVQVSAAAQLELHRAAGSDPAVHSVSSGSVVLDGGTLHVAADMDLTNLFNAATTGGSVLLRGVNFTGGGTHRLDFEQLPGGEQFRLGATADSTVGAAVVMTPDAATNTLRFGGGGATLRIDSVLADTAGTATNLEQGAGGTTDLHGANTYTGATLVKDGTLRSEHGSAIGAASTGTTVDGGTLDVNVVSPEPIVVLSGAANLNATGPSSGDVQIDGGMVNVNDTVGTFGGTALVNGGALTVKGIATGPIVVRGGTVDVRRADPSSGDIDLSGGQAIFNDAAHSYGENLTLTSGTFRATAATVTLGGRLIVMPGAHQIASTSTSTLNVEGGTIGAGRLVFKHDGFTNLNTIALGHTGGMTMDGSGTLALNVPSAHTGGTRVQQGLLRVGTDASLVGTGQAHVTGTGSLELARPAGADPALHSASPNSVLLDGGALRLAADVEVATFLDPASSGGKIQLESVTFKNGGTNVLDFAALPGGDALVLGATRASTIPAGVLLKPDTVTNTLRFGGGNAPLNVDAVLSDFAAVPTHVEQSGGRTRLRSANTYTGTTSVSGGRLEVNHAQALGTITVGTLVNGGTLQFNVVSAEPVTIQKGAVVLNQVGLASGDLSVVGGTVTLASGAGAYTSAIDMSGGTLNLDDIVAGRIAVSGGSVRVNRASFSSGDVDLSGGVMTINTPAPFGGEIELDGGVLRMGATDVTLDGGLVLGGGGTHTLDVAANRLFAMEGGSKGSGDLEVQNEGTFLVRFEGLNQNGDLILSGSGTTLIDADSAVRNVILEEGELGGSATLAPSGVLEVRSGKVEFDFSNPRGLANGSHLVKTGHRIALLNHIGSAVDIVKTVQSGVLRIGNAPGLGGPNSRYVVAERNARLTVFNTGVPDAIHLNNATGFAYEGGLIVPDGALYGDIHLGNIGSIIGMNPKEGPARVPITGTFHGGALHLAGNADYRFSTGGHTYVGATTIGLQRGGTTLDLRDQGALLSTSGIKIGHGAHLVVNNDERTSDAYLADRLGDSVPIEFRGGLLTVYGRTGENVHERVGDVSAALGGSLIIVRQSGGGAEPLLTINSLTRRGKGTILLAGVVNVDYDGVPAILFDQPPALINDMMSPWVTSGDYFTSYDPVLGVMILNDRVATVTQVDTATSTDHVWTFDPLTPLTADRTIHSFASDRDLDLGGFTLNVVSGGVLQTVGSRDTTTISNGRLTAGGAAGDAELFINVNRALRNRIPVVTVSADIVDNSGGSVDLTKSGDWSLYLEGRNTYTGLTTINDGSLIINGPDALHPGSEVNVDGGFLWVGHTSPTPFKLSVLRLRGGGVLANDGRAALEAEAYEFESGRVTARLSGGGPLIKTTRGTVVFETGQPAYFGDIVIDDGVVVAGGERFVNASNALGRGTVTVNRGGVLVHGAVPAVTRPLLLKADLILNGGELGVHELSASPLDWTFQGDLTVLDDSTVLLLDVLDMVDEVDKVVTVDIDGRTTLGDGGNLNALGIGELHLKRDLKVGSQTGLKAGLDVEIQVDGTLISNAPAASIDMAGPGDVAWTQRVHVQNGQTLLVTVDSVAAPLTFSGGGETVFGGGTLMNDFTVSRNARLQPGSSVGTLGGGADVTWGPGGVYAWQINDATGGAGSGWDMLNVSGTLYLTASAQNPFVVQMAGLDAQDVRGVVPHFDAGQSYRWPLAAAGSIVGFDSMAVELRLNAFVDHNPVVPWGIFGLDRDGETIVLSYTVPEPQVSLIVLVVWLCNRRRGCRRLSER